jgi:hypothetical protein
VQQVDRAGCFWERVLCRAPGAIGLSWEGGVAGAVARRRDRGVWVDRGAGGCGWEVVFGVGRGRRA